LPNGGELKKAGKSYGGAHSTRNQKRGSHERKSPPPGKEKGIALFRVKGQEKMGIGPPTRRHIKKKVGQKENVQRQTRGKHIGKKKIAGTKS